MRIMYVSMTVCEKHPHMHLLCMSVRMCIYVSAFICARILKDGISNQSIEYYNINEKLHDMIRDSPHNVRIMSSKVGEDEMDEDETDGDGGEDEGNIPDSSGSDSDIDDRVPISSLFDR